MNDVMSNLQHLFGKDQTREKWEKLLKGPLLEKPLTPTLKVSSFSNEKKLTSKNNFLEKREKTKFLSFYPYEELEKGKTLLESDKGLTTSSFFFPNSNIINKEMMAFAKNNSNHFFYFSCEKKDHLERINKLYEKEYKGNLNNIFLLVQEELLKEEIKIPFHCHFDSRHYYSLGLSEEDDLSFHLEARKRVKKNHPKVSFLSTMMLPEHQLLAAAKCLLWRNYFAEGDLLHVMPNIRSFDERDSWNNLLRQTSVFSSAFIGEANFVSGVPFNFLSNEINLESWSMSKNIYAVLNEEGNLAKGSLAGSRALEEVKNKLGQLVEESNKKEEKDYRILANDNWEKEIERVRCRKKSLVGINQFASNIEEDKKNKSSLYSLNETEKSYYYGQSKEKSFIYPHYQDLFKQFWNRKKVEIELLFDGELSDWRKEISYVKNILTLGEITPLVKPLYSSKSSFILFSKNKDLKEKSDKCFLYGEDIQQSSDIIDFLERVWIALGVSHEKK